MHWGLSESLDLYEEYVRALKGLPPVDYKALRERENKRKASASNADDATNSSGAEGDGVNARSCGGEDNATATQENTNESNTEEYGNGVTIEEIVDDVASTSKGSEDKYTTKPYIVEPENCSETETCPLSPKTEAPDEPNEKAKEVEPSCQTVEGKDGLKDETTKEIILELEETEDTFLDCENPDTFKDSTQASVELPEENSSNPEYFEEAKSSTHDSEKSEPIAVVENYESSSEDCSEPKESGGDSSEPPENDFDGTYNKTEEDSPESEMLLPRKLNILLFGAGDPRHIIHSVAKIYKHNEELAKNDESSQLELNFYMIDGSIEIMARNIVLLAIALEQPNVLPLRNKTHLFMDVFGNSLLRPSSHQYLAGKAKILRYLVTDQSLREDLAPFIDIESLRYAERDGLENAFHFLIPKDGHYYNIQQYWMNRNRLILGTRFDYREGVFDWDLNMAIKDRGASQICNQEYRYWRECGVAFTWPEYEQCKPNKTLAMALARNGESYLHRGYMGDLQTGPFCSFGVKCADTRMTNSTYGDNEYRATDITERNLLEYFYELENRKPYIHDMEQSRRYGSAKLLMGKTLQWNECDANTMQDYNQAWIPIEGVNIKFLKLQDIFLLQNENDRFKEMFDVVFVGHNYFSFLKQKFVNIMRPSSLLILETKLWTTERKENVAKFEKSLRDFAHKANLKPAINYSSLNTKFSTLKFKKIAEKSASP